MHVHHFYFLTNAFICKSLFTQIYCSSVSRLLQYVIVGLLNKQIRQ